MWPHAGLLLRQRRLAPPALVAADPRTCRARPAAQANIQAKDGAESWRQREAATFAFGSILEGPSVQTLSQLVHSGLPFLLAALKDPSAHVKDTTAWTIGACWGRDAVAVLAALVQAAHAPLPHCLPHSPTPCAGRIFEFVHGEGMTPPLIGPNNLPQIMAVLLEAIQDAPHIAEKARAPPRWCTAAAAGTVPDCR